MSLYQPGELISQDCRGGGSASLFIVTPIKVLTRMSAALCGNAPPAWTQQNSWSEDWAEGLPQDKALLLVPGPALAYVLATPDKD